MLLHSKIASWIYVLYVWIRNIRWIQSSLVLFKYIIFCNAFFRNRYYKFRSRYCHLIIECGMVSLADFSVASTVYCQLRTTRVPGNQLVTRVLCMTLNIKYCVLYHKTYGCVCTVLWNRNWNDFNFFIGWNRHSFKFRLQFQFLVQIFKTKKSKILSPSEVCMLVRSAVV